MSLAHKLYSIGEVITDKETIKSLIAREPDNRTDYQTVAVNFIVKDDQVIYDDIYNNYCQNVFYTEKLGGSGSAIFYLYPNLIIHNINKKSRPYDKLSQIKATLENIIKYHYANSQNETILKSILSKLADKPLIDKLKSYSKGNYLFLLTIDNHSLFKLMPEIWDNWFESPALPYKDLEVKTFYDFISGKACQVGYNPDIGCFTVNNYNDILKHRIIDNIPLSKESARYIKFGWLYVKKSLLFYFDGISFAIIPSYAKENQQEFREILTKLQIANEQSRFKRNALKVLANEEQQLLKELEKLKKMKKKDDHKIAQKEQLILKKRENRLSQKISDGLFTNFREDIKDLEFMEGVTVDFVFLELNKNEVKIFGSVEEVLPSRVSKIVAKMRQYEIDDAVLAKDKDPSQTYLHDFFHRQELYFYTLNKRKNDPKDQSYRPKIVEERLYLAKLLLTDAQISREDLYKRFEFNAEYNYKHERRIDEKGIKSWFYPQNGSKMYRDEQNILSFFEDDEINKIKD